MATLTIDCETCEMRATDACADCIVTFLCERDEQEAVVLDAGEQRVLHLLGREGLVPPLRHRATCRSVGEAAQDGGGQSRRGPGAAPAELRLFAHRSA